MNCQKLKDLIINHILLILYQPGIVTGIKCLEKKATCGSATEWNITWILKKNNKVLHCIFHLVPGRVPAAIEI